MTIDPERPLRSLAALLPVLSDFDAPPRKRWADVYWNVPPPEPSKPTRKRAVVKAARKAAQRTRRTP